MDRRAFITVVGGSIFIAPLPIQAQATGKVARIGYLAPGTATTNAGLRQAFSDGLRDHGWIEEQNIATEYRWAGDEQPTQCPSGRTRAPATTAHICHQHASSPCHEADGHQ